MLQDRLNLTTQNSIRTLDCLKKKEGQSKVRHTYIDMVNWLKASLEGMQSIAEQVTN